VAQIYNKKTINVKKKNNFIFIPII